MKAFSFLVSILFLSSCSVVQILTTEQMGDNIKIEKNRYVYENDTIKVTYSFWARNGIMTFVVENKLEIPVYIDWKKSAFINSKDKFDYYNDNEVINTKYSYRNTYNWSYWYPNERGVSESISIKHVEERITFLPPHAITRRATYSILPNMIVNMSSFPKTYIVEDKIKGRIRYYTRDNAKVIFTNFITYSTKESFEVEKYISNSFFVKKVIETSIESTDNISKYENSKSFYIIKSDQ